MVFPFIFCMESRQQSVSNRAGRSPTFWTRGLTFLGLAGTRGLASLTKEVLSFKWTRTLVGPASPWTRESQLTALVSNQ